jgi:hypothetical protein
VNAAQTVHGLLGVAKVCAEKVCAEKVCAEVDVVHV